MEHFMLGCASFTAASRTLSFLATPLGLQGILQGTSAMIAHMLTDLGLPEVPFDTWSVQHMLTNYLAEDLAAADWHDVWIDTWELAVHLHQPIKLTLAPHTLIRTYARDTTWPGHTFQPRFPTRCVLVADFYTQADAERATQVFRSLPQSVSNPAIIAEVVDQFPDIPETGLFAVRSAAIATTTTLPQVTAYARPGWPYTFLLTIADVEESFFAQGTLLTDALNDLCDDLCGTTSWDALNTVMRKLAALHNHFGVRPFTVGEAAERLRLLPADMERYLQGWCEYAPTQLLFVNDEGHLIPYSLAQLIRLPPEEPSSARYAFTPQPDAVP